MGIVLLPLKTKKMKPEKGIDSSKSLLLGRTALVRRTTY